MRLFPNPTTGVFEIELNYKGNFSIDVLNVIGENIYKMETTSNGSSNPVRKVNAVFAFVSASSAFFAVP